MTLPGPASDYPSPPQFSGTLILCGGGRTVWEDMSPFCPHIRGGGMDVMAVNDVGCHIPFALQHWYSNDAEFFTHWLAIRDMRKKPYKPNFATHTFREYKKDKAKYAWPWPGHGTSSLNAVYTGLALGYEEIILCGVPLDDNGHYFDPPWVGTNFTNEVKERDDGLQYWARASREVFGGRVKSMSGRTRELLGAP